ncbi:MAG TPA: lipid A deacylase LpxR family protein [Planctomycetes bacterium]|nr:lipid A deacylase LpxR family protein [Planctomycetota bacterium]
MEHGLGRVGVGLVLLLAGSCQSAPEPGVYTFVFENDVFAHVDSNYTNGVGLSWVSPVTAPSGDGTFLERIVDRASFLPGVGSPDREHHVGFLFAQEMFTPDDITIPNPPRTDRPYAGVLLLDTSVFARDEDSMHTWTLKLGVVGPPALAEETQTIVHRWIGSNKPEGWDHQLHTEPLVNLNYAYDRRIVETEVLGLEFDLTSNVGGAFGNYAIFANTGVALRWGRNLTDSYGTQSLRAGTQSNSVVLTPPAKPFGWNLFVGTQGFLAGRFLPQDGNTFIDSRGVDTETLVGSASFGFVVNYKRVLMTVSFTAFSDTFEGQKQAMEYGSFLLTWSP